MVPTWTLMHDWTATLALVSSAPSAAPDAEEAKLIAACRRGDEAAFAELVRRHQRRVFRLAGRFFRRPEEVEEVSQETFLAAWKRLDGFRGEAPFEHWLTRVCLNCCYARLRQGQRRPPEAAMPDEMAAPSGDPNARLEVDRLMRSLSSADRFMLLLLHGEGWSVQETAARLGWSRVAVRVRAHRARRKLRRLLEEGSTP
jgi:RNA polymerase sigma-70 factor (ECF subfamily)